MTPETIQHEGKTLVRMPRIEDAGDGDWMLVGDKLIKIPESKEFFNVCKFADAIDAAYREKKAEVHEWIQTIHLSPAENKVVNDMLTSTYGSPESLMRKGAEQVIQLTEEEWVEVHERYQDGQYIGYASVIIEQALANCRPKGGAE